jgi:hypothetical protein
MPNVDFKTDKNMAKIKGKKSIDILITLECHQN